MKFVISEVFEDETELREYIGMTCSVQDWFCHERIPSAKEAKLLRTSEKAMRFLIAGKVVWIPRSLMKIDSRKEKLLGEF